MKPFKKIKFIVVHHTRGSYDSVEAIRKFHKNVRGWEDIGYRWVIGDGKGLVDGKLYKGRSEKFIGAHVLGHNKNSISVCLIGNLDKSPPTKKQLQTLFKFLKQKMRKYNIPVKNILGHNEFAGVKKTCPGKFLDMNEVRKEVRVE